MDTTMKAILPARIVVVPIIQRDDETDEMLWDRSKPLTKEDLEELGYRHRDDLNRAMRDWLNACAGVERGAGFGDDTGPYALLRIFIQSIIDYDLVDSSDFGPDAPDSEVFPRFKWFMDRGMNE